MMTGHMAPGKDSPAATDGNNYAQREEAWRQWKNKHGKCIRAMLAAFEYILE